MRSFLVRLSTLALAAFAFTACDKKSAPTTSDASIKTTIAMLPKLVNIDYFDACKRGAEKAAAETGVTLIYDGPK